MNQDKLKIATDFFSIYKVEPLDDSAFLISSSKEQLLVRTHLIHAQDEETIEQVSNLLDMHLSFDTQYIAPLVHFERCPEGIRAFYTVDRLTLRQEIQNRAQEKQLFTQEQLWIILSSLVDSLQYMQGHGSIYGVLSSSKVFISDRIRLMDPSAFNLAPINVSRLTYHSPQIAETSSSIDFYQSDVYLLGLCMLQAASLVKIDNKITKNLQKQLFQQVSTHFSAEFMHVLGYLLKEQAHCRPSFSDIKQYIQKVIQIQGTKLWPADNLSPDVEDTPSVMEVQCLRQEENIDYLEEEDKVEQYRKMTQYQKARDKFLSTPVPRKKGEFLSTNYSSKQTVKQNYQQSNGRKRTQQSKYVPQFNPKLNETTNKKQKLSRALQIKNRNSEHVKKIQSSRYDPNRQLFTDPALISVLQQQTERAKQFQKTRPFK